MIRLCNSSVITVSVNGTTKVFEPEEVQGKLVKSLIATGIRDTWIAEDISLAVEYSLGDLGPAKVFTVSEIDSFVMKILREVGLNDVAEHYGTTQHAGLKTVVLSRDRISDTVKRFLGLEGAELFTTADKVFNACTALGLNEAFPSLILELAKYYHHEDFEKAAGLVTMPVADAAGDIWSLSAEQIISTLSEEATDMINSGILALSGISRLFPSIRIDVNFANFADYFALTPPVTELAMIPYLDKLGTALDEIVNSAENLYKDSVDENASLPVYMKFTDAMLFATDWLGGEWPESARCLEDIIALLVEMLNCQVNIRNLPSI